MQCLPELRGRQPLMSPPKGMGAQSSQNLGAQILQNLGARILNYFLQWGWGHIIPYLWGTYNLWRGHGASLN